MEMQPKHKKIAALGLCRALPDLARIPKGRLENLFKKLVREVDKNLANNLYNWELVVIRERLDKFRDASGWGKKERHICTYVTFCMAVCEDTGLPQAIIDRLADIWYHFDRVGKAPAASNWAGVLAAEKWDKIVNV